MKAREALEVFKQIISIKIISIVIAGITVLSLVFVPVSPAAAERVDVSYGYTYELGIEDWANFTHLEAVTHDAQNSVYMVGDFQGTVDFNPGAGTDNKTAVGINDLFVTKFNADGTYSYTKTVGAASVGTYGSDVGIDSTGNVYVAMQFAGTVDFNPGAGTDSRVSAGSFDAAILKLTASGDYIQAYTFGGSGIDYPYELDIDTNDNVYTAGRFTGTADFDPSGGTDSRVSAGGQDIFLTKLNANGTYGFAYTVGSTSTDNAFSLVTTPNGSVFVAGRFDGTVDFDPGAGTDNKTSISSDDGFVTKLDTNGVYGYTNVLHASVGESVLALTADSNSNVYVTGSFTGTADFDPSGSVDNKSSNGVTRGDAFLTKLNANGSYGYTHIWGGSSTSWSDTGEGLITDAENNLYVLSQVDGTVDLNPGSGTDNKTSLNGDLALTKFDSSGNYLYGYITAVSDTNTYLSAVGPAITVDNMNDIYYIGTYEGNSVDLNPLSGVDSRVSAAQDNFLTKIKQVTYQQITGLNGLLSVATLTNVSASDNNIESGTTTTIRLSKSGVPIADTQTTFDADLDWSAVSADTDLVNGKAFVHNLSAVSGTANDFTLYIPKLSGHTGAGVCPGATSLAATNSTCAGLYYVTEGTHSNISSVTINGASYWRVTGLSGTGGFSAATELVGTGTNLTTIALPAVAGLVTAVIVNSLSRKRSRFNY